MAEETLSLNLKDALKNADPALKAKAAAGVGMNAMIRLLEDPTGPSEAVLDSPFNDNKLAIVRKLETVEGEPRMTASLFEITQENPMKIEILASMAEFGDGVKIVVQPDRDKLSPEGRRIAEELDAFTAEAVTIQDAANDAPAAPDVSA